MTFGLQSQSPYHRDTSIFNGRQFESAVQRASHARGELYFFSLACFVRCVANEIRLNAPQDTCYAGHLGIRDTWENGHLNHMIIGRKKTRGLVRMFRSRQFSFPSSIFFQDKKRIIVSLQKSRFMRHRSLVTNNCNFSLKCSYCDAIQHSIELQFLRQKQTMPCPLAITLCNQMTL